VSVMSKELDDHVADFRSRLLTVDHDPVRYSQLVAHPAPKKKRPTPPGRRGRPPSLDRPRAARPWRHAPSTNPVGSDG